MTAADRSSTWAGALGSFGASQNGPVAYAWLVAAVACQLATLAITWPLWHVRLHPPNLPLTSVLPDVSFAWAMVVSLLVSLIHPRIGVLVHAGVLMTACLFDQFRLQPQFFGLAILMIACTGQGGLRICRWYLAAMWLWAGLHKLISPDWMGHASWSLLEQAGLDVVQLHRPLALGVAGTEMVLGLMAFFRPGWAARLCVAVHLGIVAFLSPFFAGMNNSVIPWNLAIAGIGYWLLMKIAREGTRKLSAVAKWEKSLVVVLLVMPAGFYVGWVDRSLCHVLYSDFLPRVAITNKSGVVGVRSWRELAVPFPSERRLYRLYFELTADPGDKAHIYEPRPLLTDQYFVMRATGAVEITVDEFFAVMPGEVSGIGFDQPRSVFALSRAGVQMMRESDGSMIYAVAFIPENFDRDLLGYLAGLPNLQQIQFSGTDLRDEDLRQLTSLRMLTGLGLNHTKVTDQGLRQLDGLPFLQYVEREGTTITEYGSE